MTRGKPQVKVLGKLWEWAKEVLNTEMLNNNLLLDKEWDEETLLHHASFRGSVHVFERYTSGLKNKLH